MTSVNPVACEICKGTFPTRNSLFKHLKNHGFIDRDRIKLEKSVLLVGWISEKRATDSAWLKDGNLSHKWSEEIDFIEKSIWQALCEYDKQNGFENGCDDRLSPKGYSRGSSCAQRASYLLGEEETCHGACDVLCFPANPTPDNEDIFIDKINILLPPNVRVHARFPLSSKGASDFHAESTCSHRRYEYLLPLNVLFPPNEDLSQNLQVLPFLPHTLIYQSI